MIVLPGATTPLWCHWVIIRQCVTLRNQQTTLRCNLRYSAKRLQTNLQKHELFINFIQYMNKNDDEIIRLCWLSLPFQRWLIKLWAQREWCNSWFSVAVDERDFLYFLRFSASKSKWAVEQIELEQVKLDTVELTMTEALDKCVFSIHATAQFHL